MIWVLGIVSHPNFPQNKRLPRFGDRTWCFDLSSLRKKSFGGLGCICGFSRREIRPKFHHTKTYIQMPAARNRWRGYLVHGYLEPGCIMDRALTGQGSR